MATHSSILAWKSLVGYSQWGCKESDMPELLTHVSSKRSQCFWTQDVQQIVKRQNILGNVVNEHRAQGGQRPPGEEGGTRQQAEWRGGRLEGGVINRGSAFQKIQRKGRCEERSTLGCERQDSRVVMNEIFTYWETGKSFWLIRVQLNFMSVEIACLWPIKHTLYICFNY